LEIEFTLKDQVISLYRGPNYIVGYVIHAKERLNHLFCQAGLLMGMSEVLSCELDVLRFHFYMHEDKILGWRDLGCIIFGIRAWLC